MSTTGDRLRRVLVSGAVVAGAGLGAASVAAAATGSTTATSAPASGTANPATDPATAPRGRCGSGRHDARPGGDAAHRCAAGEGDRGG